MSKDKFQDKYRIESARAKWHDYDNGFYFVTICTKNREYFFGTIQNTEMVLSETGKYLKQQLQTIGEHYLYAEIPLWTIMPNHIHLIVSIDGGRLPHKKRDIPVLEKKFTFRKCRNGMCNQQTIVAVCRNTSNQAVSNAFCEAE